MLQDVTEKVSHDEVRRANRLILLNEFIDDFRRVNNDASLFGIEARFARKMHLHPSLLSGLKSTRRMGTKLARRIECECGKPAGWLDSPQPIEPKVPRGLTNFLAAAAQAYRESDKKGRADLEKALREKHAERVTEPLR